MSKMYVTHKDVLDEAASITDWDMGIEMAADILNDINLVSKRPAPFRIDSEDYKIYWAGSILRIDIRKEAVS